MCRRPTIFFALPMAIKRPLSGRRSRLAGSCPLFRCFRKLNAPNPRGKRALPAVQARGVEVLQDHHAAQMNLDDPAAPDTVRTEELCPLDEALTASSEIDPRRAQVIELRFFAGLSVEETAPMHLCRKLTIHPPRNGPEVHIKRVLDKQP